MKYLIFFLVILNTVSCNQTLNLEEIERFEGLYFNQVLPNEIVSRFAAEIFTEELHSPPVFTPDGTEVYWNYMEDVMHNHIQFMKIVDGVWTEAADAPFSINAQSDSPFISSDGNKLVFL